MAFLASIKSGHRRLKSGSNYRNIDTITSNFHKTVSCTSWSSEGNMAGQVIKELSPHVFNAESSNKMRNMSIKSKLSNEKKSAVYVHQFTNVSVKNSMIMQHKNDVYRQHLAEHSNKLEQINRNMFDSLSLAPHGLRRRQMQHGKHSYAYPVHTTSDYYNEQYSDIPYIKSSPNAKLHKNRTLPNKAAIDKLEESFWAKWKPSKTLDTHVKTKDNTKKKCYKTSLKNVKERGDSSETIMAQFSRKSGASDEENAVIYLQPEAFMAPNTFSEPTMKDTNEENSAPLVIAETIKTEAKKQELRLLQPGIISASLSPHLANQESEQDEVEHSIKHTDSFILTVKKQNQKKPHYQQPKCIKLCKNSSSAITGTCIKGGSYPLKSCLKEASAKTSARLGRPLIRSPNSVTNKKSSKSKCFRK